MSKKPAISPIPDGFHTITPYLAVDGAAALIDFVTKAFDAEVTSRTDANGKVMNAELRVGTSMIMVADARGGGKRWPAMLYLYVPDVDAAYAQAVKAGAKVVHAPEDMFYGDRSGGVEDAFGNQWWFGARIENVTPEEMRQRLAQKRG